MKAWLIPVMGLLMAGCGEVRTPPPATVGQASAQRNLELMDENRAMAQREERDIRDWMARQRMEMIASGTGLRYKLVRDLPGDTARPGQLAVLNYAVLLLNGDTAYASEAGHPESFLIEHADVESGLHEGVQHLSVGDSAVLVIPSALAHGLVGDQDKIPMRSTIIYHIGLVDLRK